MCSYLLILKIQQIVPSVLTLGNMVPSDMLECDQWQ